VARAVASETRLDRGSRDGGVGTGLADSSGIGEDLGAAVHGGVKVKAGVKVLGSGAKGFCVTS
jgi:hypothetical protein